MSQEIDKIAVIGLGTLGTQIAVQSACYGIKVKAFDPIPGILQKTLPKITGIAKALERTPTLPIEEWLKGAEKIKVVTEMREVLKDVDLAIEVVPENLELKQKVFAEIDSLAEPKTILATNSSSIPVSRIERATKRPEKCLNIHFYQPVLGVIMADVMGGTKTTPDVFEAGKNFVRSVGCVPLTVNKEILGFCFNSVWRAIKKQTLYMWGNGFADFQDIDRAWMIMYKTKEGPFGMMDLVGLDVVYDIEMMYHQESKDPRDIPPQALKDMIERKELGIKTGKGFYEYPNPDYRNPEFLKP